ncbi:MAG: flagellar export chaperone FliS [Muribaculaceae bacterium]|nr:flagellar export chaperone FliS [Muribaculaceae bacterium]
MAMPARNPFAEYTNNKIMTASPAEVTLMLYEGAIKFCNIAIIAIEHGEMEKAHVNIKKTQRIIEEFRNTLDRQYEVAEEFDKIYTYLLQRLLEANVKKDKEILEEVNRHLRSVRDTWKEVMKRCNEA